MLLRNTPPSHPRHANARRAASLHDLLRLLAGALSAALGLLAVVEARSWTMVVLTLGVTEWGHALALAALGLLAGRSRTRAGRASTWLGLLAGALALSPLVRAAMLARHLPAQLASAFGAGVPRSTPQAPARTAPLRIRDLFLGVRSPRVHKHRETYIQRGKQALILDLYQPLESRGAAPCLVVIHGGSWENGDSRQIPGLNSYLAARGYIVAAITYRLAPFHAFPAQREDVLAALAYLRDNAARLGIDPQQFVLLGRSAGAQLALLVAYSAGDPAIRGVIDFYGPADLVYGHQHPARKSVIDSVGVIERYLGGSPDSAPTAYAEAAPISYASRRCPPTLLIHGGRDNLVAPIQSRKLATQLAQAGNQHLLLELPWATHGCDVNFSGPSGQISTYAIERFLAAITPAPAARP